MKKGLSVLLSIALFIGTCSPVFALTAQNTPTISAENQTQSQPQSSYPIIEVTGPFSSDHPYSSSIGWNYTNPDTSAKRLGITFSANTKTVYEDIALYDGNGSFVGDYSGDELAGKTIFILGNHFSLILYKHYGEDDKEAYGFDVTEIKGYTDLAFSGTCGDNLTWSFDLKAGVLDITGTGDMYDYTEDYCPPWKSFNLYIIEINIGSSVTSIGDYAFALCRRFELIDIPESVASIGAYAFFRCKSYWWGSIGAGVKTVGDYAFAFCGRFFHDSSLILPETLVSIGDYAFSHCNYYRNAINIPNSVTYIGNYAFAWSGIQSLTIGSGVETIGDGAFFGNSNLREANFTGNAPKMGDSVFGGTSHDEYFIVNYYKGKTGFGNGYGWHGYKTKSYYITLYHESGEMPDILAIKVDRNKSYKSASIDVWFESNLPNIYDFTNYVDCEPATYMNYQWSSDSLRIVLDENGHLANRGIFARAANITLKVFDNNGTELRKTFKVIFYKYDWQLKYLNK